MKGSVAGIVSLHTPICSDIYTHMKTTIEIADSLLQEVKRHAHEENTSVRALVEEGLREVLRKRATGKPFRLRKVTFGGSGLTEEFKDASWERIRDEIYRGRGA